MTTHSTPGSAPGLKDAAAQLPPEKPTHRQVELHRVEQGRYAVANVRGGTMTIGHGQNDDFTPVELLLAGIAGCTAVDVDFLTSRRSEPDSFVVAVEAEKVADEQGNHLRDIVVTFRVAFPEGSAGDAAREVLPKVVKQSHDRLCTVSRTVMLGADVTTVID